MVLEVLHQLQACSPAPGESTPSWTSTLNHHCPPLNYVTWRTQVQGKIPTFIFTETLLTTFLYVCIEYSQGCLAMAGRWKSENNLQKVDVSFLFPPCGNGAQVIRLMAKCFYPPQSPHWPHLYSFENFMHNCCVYVISTSPSTLFSSS